MPEKINLKNESKLSDDVFQEWDRNTNRQQFLTRLTKERDYYFGKQWTSEEVIQLKLRGQSDLVINKIRPAIKFMSSMLNGNSPYYTAISRQTSKVDLAEAYQQIYRYIHYISKGRTQLALAINDCLISGLGNIHVYKDMTSDFGNGDIKIKRERNEEVLYDPNAEDVLFQDSEHILITRQTTKRKLVKVFPNLKKEINEATSAMASTDRGSFLTATSTGYFATKDNDTQDFPIGRNPFEQGNLDNNTVLKLVQRYTKFMDTVKAIYTPDARLVAVVDTDEQVKQIQVANNLFDVAVIDIPVPRIKKILTILESGGNNGVMLSMEILPLRDYPIVPIIDEYTENSTPVGEVNFLMGMQEVLNKSMSMTIYNAQMTGHERVTASEGVIKDVGKFKSTFMTPGEPTIIDLTDPNSEFKVHPTSPLTQSFGTLVPMMAAEIQDQSGMFNLRRGDPSDAPDTQGATELLASFSEQRLAPIITNLDESLSAIGRILSDYIPLVYTTQKIINIIGDDGEMTQDQLVLNEQIQEDINTAKQIKNNIKENHYDLVFKNGSYIATNRQQQLNQLLRLANAGLKLDNVTILENLDIKGLKGALQRNSEIVALQNQLAQAINQMKQLGDENKQLTNIARQETKEKEELQIELNVVKETMREVKSKNKDKTKDNNDNK